MKRVHLGTELWSYARDRWRAYDDFLADTTEVSVSAIQEIIKRVARKYMWSPIGGAAPVERNGMNRKRGPSYLLALTFVIAACGGGEIGASSEPPTAITAPPTTGAGASTAVPTATTTSVSEPGTVFQADPGHGTANASGWENLRRGRHSCHGCWDI